jgi:hypothetical protein
VLKVVVVLHDCLGYVTSTNRLKMPPTNLSQVQAGGDTDIEMSVAVPAANAGNVGPPSRNTRSRIDPSVQTPGFQVQSPLKIAEDHIISHTSSLHEGLATLLLDKGKKIISLKHKLFLKERNISRM